MGRWLLIGNSRWHWAAGEPPELQFWHGAPGVSEAPLVAWAAVGAVPGAAGLDPARRLELAAIPLGQAPPWLGVDRALGGWEAWRQSQGASVLVADAGTALSLTRVDAEGCFAGGRLMAGAGLQWRSLAAATAQLPLLIGVEEAATGTPRAPVENWPQATEPGLRSGVLWGLAAAIAAAAHGAAADLAGWDQPRFQLWLTGGDGAELEPLVQALLAEPLASSLKFAPNLALTALAALVPAGP